MSDCETLRETVVQAITDAFDGVTRQNAITLHEAQVIDEYGMPDERAAARLLDTEHRWQDISDRHIEECSDALGYLCPVGFRYYLPARMIYVLNHYRSSHCWAVENTIYGLCTSGRLHDYRPHQFAILSQEQSRAVCLFLWYLVECGHGYVDEDAVVEALTRYWSRFCSDADLATPPGEHSSHRTTARKS